MKRWPYCCLLQIAIALSRFSAPAVIGEERGRADGHDLDDWLCAEAEITAKNARTAAA